MAAQQLIFTVTNDLTYDRRMDRICSTLAAHGYQVKLVGRKLKNSLPLKQGSVEKIRLNCWFNGGFLFYAEYNIRLFLFLLFQGYDAACACDLDTALPVRFASWLKRKKTILDAHEFFTEVPEITNRRFTKMIWEAIGEMTIPKFRLRYTVGDEIAHLMSEKYHVDFQVIRNSSPQVHSQTTGQSVLRRENIIFYQGAINEGRGLEVMVEAMKGLPQWQFWLAGEGDITMQLKRLANECGVTDRVKFLGWVLPENLPALMDEAKLGINLRDKRSLNDYYSLPNKFFDFINAGLPSINMNYPEYESICQRYPCAILINHLSVHNILEIVTDLEHHPEQLEEIVRGCHEAAKVLNWETESKKLIALYDALMQD